MAPLTEIFGFLSVLLRGLTLVAESLTVGGLIFLVLIARKTAVAFPRALLAWSAMLLAASQSAYVAANSLLLVGSTDMQWSDLWGATFVIAGSLVVLGAFLVVGSLHSGSLPARSIACVLILVGSVMESHSVSRVDHRALLVALTLSHHVAGAAWIGGMPYLILSLRCSLENGSRTALTTRFSRIAIVSVALLAAAGAGLSTYYVGTGAALTGTTYGIMLATKVILTLAVLFVGALNFKISRTATSDLSPAWLRLRRFAEVEAAIGCTILLSAASLTSTPPAVDVQAGIVMRSEIAQRVTPQWPRIETPRFSELSPVSPLGPASVDLGSFVPGQSRGVDTSADTAWSEYNHNCAGIVVLAIGAGALLARRYSSARNWPLLFLLLAAFLFLRADPENWPLGPRGFWESFQVAEVAQHRIFVVLIVLFAVFEWAVQTNRLSTLRAGLVFPLVCAAGGALLLTHSHSLTNVKEEFLAELSHLPLAVLAILAGWSRWLEIRLPHERLRAVQWVWPTCILLIGALLVNYREH